MKKVEKALEKLLKKINKTTNPDAVRHVIFGDRLDPMKSLKRWKKEVNY